MQLVTTVALLRRQLTGRRDVTLVATMGNLHDGHLSLVRIARERAGPVVASIFVNRLQFAPQEDFASYPRTLERDLERLAECGCDIVFAPTDEEMYPEQQGFSVQPAAALADTLEGAIRPDFFAGVCTVVLKLCNIVQPEAAVFGKKDYQQLLVIRSMFRQLALPVELIPAATVREPAGLALSSRNGYLGAAERAEAPRLYALLGEVAAAVRAGRSDWAALEAAAMQSLRERGWQPDYVAIRRQADLGPPAPAAPLVVLAGARLGGTRLIDNLEI